MNEKIDKSINKSIKCKLYLVKWLVNITLVLLIFVTFAAIM